MVFAILGTLVLVVAALLVVALVAFKTYSISSTSMAPTLEKHDVVMVNRLVYAHSTPKDGAIVVFQPPIPDAAPFLKRVIATPGERLRIHGGRLYRNGAALSESYVTEPTAYELEIKNYNIYVDGVPLDRANANLPAREDWTSADKVPPGCYVLLGDFRNNSEDSHIWGCAQDGGRFYSGPLAGRRADTFGRVISIISPTARAGAIK